MDHDICLPQRSKVPVHVTIPFTELTHKVRVYEDWESISVASHLLCPREWQNHVYWSSGKLKLSISEVCELSHLSCLYPLLWLHLLPPIFPSSPSPLPSLSSFPVCINSSSLLWLMGYCGTTGLMVSRHLMFLPYRTGNNLSFPFWFLLLLLLLCDLAPFSLFHLQR